MGRMLEALKRSDESTQIVDAQAKAVRDEAEFDESNESEMPFVEVGGPRSKTVDPVTRLEIPAPFRAPESAPRLEMPAPRPPVLQPRDPRGVALQPGPTPSTTRSRVSAELVTFHHPEHPVSKQYAALFSQLDLEPTDAGAPAYLFTGLTRGAGTTTTLLNLAIAGARQHGKKIIVIDANVTRPALASRLGMTPSAGLLQVLRGKIALEQAVLATPIDNLQVMPIESAAQANVISADAFRWVQAWLQQRSDVVFVDAPAWEEEGRVESLLPAVTALYLVVDSGETENHAVRQLTRDAARLGCHLGGLIVTQ